MEWLRVEHAGQILSVKKVYDFRLNNAIAVFYKWICTARDEDISRPFASLAAIFASSLVLATLLAVKKLKKKKTPTRTTRIRTILKSKNSTKIPTAEWMIK